MNDESHNHSASDFHARHEENRLRISQIRERHRQEIRDQREEHRQRVSSSRERQRETRRETREKQLARRPRIEPRFFARFLISIVAVLTAIILIWSFVQWLTPVVFKAVGIAPGEFLGGVIDLLATFLLFGLIATIIGRVVGTRQIDFFFAMNDALKKISKGDFSVSVPVDAVQGRGGPDNQFRELAVNINDMAAALSRMEELRQEFVSNVSHEIQSPLTSIIGFAQALKESDLSGDERARYLTIIETESRRLSRLSDNLLKLNALGDGDAQLHLRDFELDESIRSALLAAEPQWSAKAIEIEADLFPCLVHADQDLIAQVWQNLLQNAIKFTPNKGRISVKMSRGTLPGVPSGTNTGIDVNKGSNGENEQKKALDCIVVMFDDSGIGIEASNIPRVFERFFKADGSRSHAEETAGNGLGLAIVSKIIALHHGEVTVESAGLGKGSSFVVKIPLAS